MNRIDRLMLMTAQVTLGVLLLESIVPKFVVWIIPFLDQRGLPHMSMPFFQVVVLIVCLWCLHVMVCRVVLVIGAGILLLVSVMADIFALMQFQTVWVKYGDYILLGAFMEGLCLFGFFSLIWVSLRPPKRDQIFLRNFSFHHARA